MREVGYLRPCLPDEFLAAEERFCLRRICHQFFDHPFHPNALSVMPSLRRLREHEVSWSQDILHPFSKFWRVTKHPDLLFVHTSLDGATAICFGEGACHRKHVDPELSGLFPDLRMKRIR